MVKFMKHIFNSNKYYLALFYLGIAVVMGIQVIFYIVVKDGINEINTNEENEGIRYYVRTSFSNPFLVGNWTKGLRDVGVYFASAFDETHLHWIWEVHLPLVLHLVVFK